MTCAAVDSPCVIGGDDWNYYVTYTENDETIPINLTGATATMEMRDAVTDAAIVVTASGGITTATEGKMIFTLTDVQTAGLLPRATDKRTLVFSVKITFSDASEQTILIGTLTLDQAATE
jgi:hypothetical protein